MPPTTRVSVATRPARFRAARRGSAATIAVLVAFLAVVSPLAGSGSFGSSGIGSLGGGRLATGSAADDGTDLVADAAAGDGSATIDATTGAPGIDPFGGAPAPDAVPAEAASDGADVPDGSAGPDGSAVDPSIQYDDAAAHAHDPNRFTPGGTVAVPYRPSAKDAWAVDGGDPRPLPAGAASGRAMAAAQQGSAWTGRPPSGLAYNGADGAGAAIAASAADGGSPVDGPSVARIAAVPAVAVAPAPAPDDSSAAGSNLHRQVFGFLPYWTLADRSTVIDYGLLSTIAYFSVGADRAGNLLKKDRHGSTTTGWGGWTSSKLTSVIAAAHRAHTRVVLTVSVFAWTSGQAALQAALLGSSKARLNLARQVAAAVRDRGADGVNLDFEPIAAGHSADFTALVRTIRSQLDRVHRGYQLTFDTTGLIGNYPIEDATAPGGADAIFIMGYDYRTSSAKTAGSIDPLDGSGYTLTDTIAAYTQRVPASKLILGLPYYGRAWSTTTNALGAPTRDGATYGRSNAVSYATAARLARRYTVHYDPISQVAWFAYRQRTCTAAHGCVTSWRQVYFDDARSLKARYDLVVQSGLRGTGLWALGYDETRPELYGAISQKFVHDTTAPVTGVAVLPSTVGDAGFVVSWRSADISAIRSYDVQVSADGGPWRAWRTATTATSDVYLGADGHAYAFRARATDAAGNVGAWDVGSRYDATPSLAVGGFGRIAVDSIAARTSADTSALRVATLTAGQAVAIVGGPRSADGYTWYQVTGPLAEWDTVRSTRTGMWIPVRTASRSFVSAAVAPNATVVHAGVDGLTFGDQGTASLGHAPLALVARVFSPNGDGSRDRLRLRWKNHLAFDSLTLRILRPDGRLVGTRTLPDRGAGPQAYDWDGRLASGRAVADGTYVLQLVGRSRGRTYSAPSSRPTTAAQVALYAITLDRVPPRILSATSTAGRISPNGDGRSDSLTVTATSTGATGWTFVVAPLNGSKVGPPVRTVSGGGSRAVVRWNGRSDAGAIVPDGTYRLSMIAWDPAGNRAVRSGTIVVDDRPATLAFAVGPARISPDGDGAADSTVASWTSSEPVRGIVSLVRGSTTVRTWVFGTSIAHSIGWDGRDARGRLVKEGMYVVRLRAYDATGNLTIVERRVVVDRTVARLRWGPAAFDPQDGDRILPTSRVSFTLTRSATVSLRIVGPGGAVVRTALVGRHLSAGRHGWTWDGRTAGGAWVAPGAYTAVLQVHSSLGTTTLQRPIFVGAFTIAPSATVIRTGRMLTITIASVEPLGPSPVVTFRQTGGAARVRTATAIGGGRYRVSFRIAAHGTGPATIVVSGRDAGGKTNRASTVITVR